MKKIPFNQGNTVDCKTSYWRAYVHIPVKVDGQNPKTKSRSNCGAVPTTRSQNHLSAHCQYPCRFPHKCRPPKPATHQLSGMARYPVSRSSSRCTLALSCRKIEYPGRAAFHRSMLTIKSGGKHLLFMLMCKIRGIRLPVLLPPLRNGLLESRCTQFEIWKGY